MTKLPLSVAGLLVLSGLFWACSQSDRKAAKQLENDVFAIHDEVMPKTGELLKLRKQLNQRISSLDSTKKSGSASATLRIDEEQDQAQRLVKNIKTADSLMMYWMDHYSSDSLDKLPPEEALRYVERQKDQITDVKTKVNNSIKEAKDFLVKP